MVSPQDNLYSFDKCTWSNISHNKHNGAYYNCRESKIFGKMSQAMIADSPTGYMLQYIENWQVYPHQLTSNAENQSMRSRYNTAPITGLSNYYPPTTDLDPRIYFSNPN